MRSYRSEKVFIGKSPKINGKGLIAKEKISKGEVVCVKGGSILTDCEFNSLGELEKQYCLQIAEHLFIGPKTAEELPENAIFINHSCEPNVGFSGEITYIAMRDIKAGEELTHDYAMCFTTALSGLLPMSCTCGSSLCRKLVTGDDWLLPPLRERYNGYFARFIQQRLNKA